MTKRTWLLRFVTTLLMSGLVACGGSGGGSGGGGGGGIPTASNAAITPPPAAPVSITTAGGATSTTNQGIAANAFQASGGAMNLAATAASRGSPDIVALVLGAGAENAGTQDDLGTLAEIVRRHAEKLKDHQASVNQGDVTSALQVDTQPCSRGGTVTNVFDDANLSATEVFVNCNKGATILHGTLSSTNVSVKSNPGSTVGSPYTVAVTATFSVDVSIVTTASGSTIVNQGSFNFTATFSGNMQAAAGGGVEQGAPNRLQISLGGASILIADGPVRSRLSNFSLNVDGNDTLGSTTIFGNYTYASTLIGGSVTVLIQPSVVFQPRGTSHPISGGATLSSSGFGKIVLTVISSPVVGVKVDVYANAADALPADTANLTWAQVDAL